MSFFAFTATPRNVTLERFGERGPDGLPRPFHLYAMRQAIEEGFILDVLQHYMTYNTYYQLEKAVEDDPELGSRRGQRQVARYASLEPEAIAQKAEIIVEHFRDNVMNELDGGAKAMVVTSSRAHALQYYFAIRDYLNARGYDDMRTIVAFSDELQHDGESWTEAALNGFPETELPRRFKETPELRFLVVAEKYQTGFDEPALCAMYVDRKLAGLQAVQTLSRLNRTHSRFPNKRTFVLDFQNTKDDIREAFMPYFEATELSDVTDLNQVHDLYDRLLNFPIIDRGEVERFAETYFAGMLGGAGREGDAGRGDAGRASAGGLTSADRIRLEALIRQAVERFRAMDDEGEQEEFRQLLRSYMRFYSFVAQVVTLGDPDLEKMYEYASWLSRLLPNRDVPEEIEITDDMLELYAFRVEQARAAEDAEDYDISLRAGETETLDPIGRFGVNPYTEEEQRSLSEIIETFNERHGTNFTEADILRMERVNDDLLADDDTVAMLRNNPPDVAINAFAEAFLQGLIRMFQKDREMQSILLTDTDARNLATKHFFNRAWRQVHEERPGA